MALRAVGTPQARAVSSTGVTGARLRQDSTVSASERASTAAPFRGRRPIWRSLAVQLIRDALAADRARWPLWLPIAFAVGIGGYFALPWEPPYWVALAGPIPVVAAAWLMRGRDGPLWLSLFVLFAVFGAATATLRTAGVDTAMLTRPLWATVDGTVVGVERRPDDTRLTLEALSIAALRLPEDPPERVRVVLRRPGALQIGDRVRLRARLSPPPPPTVPGGFDFQRRAYFAGLGAVGFAIGDAEILSTDGRRRWSLAVDGLRARIAARLTRDRKSVV